MRYQEKHIGSRFAARFLELAVYDDEDVSELKTLSPEKNVMTEVEFLPYLKYFTSIENLILLPGEMPEDPARHLAGLQNVVRLGIEYDNRDADDEYRLDLSAFRNVEYIASKSSWNFRNAGAATALKYLQVQYWCEDDLESLAGTNIDTLSISGGRLCTLEVSEQIPLKVLSLSYLRRLESLSGVEALPLKMLELDHCSKISDFDLLRESTVEYLLLYGGNRLNDIGFISDMRCLRRAMLDVFVGNGDLSPLDSLEKAVILTDKKNFNRKNSDLPKTVEEYSVSGIPSWRFLFGDRRL